MDNCTPTDLIQLDLCNAFDTLDHNILLHKIAQHGLCGSLLLWLSRFLTGRAHRMLFHDEVSDNFTVTSGVPQGSVLGPTLFLLYIKDMPTSSECLLVQYTDDSTILAPVTSLLSVSGVQDFLDQIGCWTRINNLTISQHKSAAMRLTNSRSGSLPAHSLSGAPIAVVQSLPILGVFFSSLDFSQHITNTVSKAHRTLGFVTRVSRAWGPETFCALYTALVLPRLEYCCSV